MVIYVLKLVAVIAVALSTPAAALWPIPRNMTSGTTALKLSPGFNINVQVKGAPSDLEDAVQRISTFIKTDKLERLVVGRGATDAHLLGGAKTLSSLNVALAPGAKAARSISIEATADLTTRDESYTLTVPAGGAATLTAKTTLGLLRGLTTFSQLWYVSGATTYTLTAPLAISDSPAFPYRGFMLDTARNFYPVSDILRVLDTMSAVKLNQFHWHVVDSQSFPLVVPAMPEISAAGAYAANMVYSPTDVKTITSYAAARGIDVVVEIDTPGHTSVISKSHPDFIACAESTPWSASANEPPAGQLRFADPAVAAWTAKLITNVASALPSKLFSTGGDEINQACYTADAPTQASLAQRGLTFEQALSSFTQTTHGALATLGKTPVVWEEMVLEHNVTLSKSTVVMVWISSANVGAVAAKGFRIVHAASDFFYLDCGMGGWVGNNIQGDSWCSPFKTWQKIYSFDPFNGVPAGQQNLVLGGEALLWSEQSDPSNLDSNAFPRGVTQAEVFWTGATLPSGAARNVDEALPRLHDIRFRLVQRGVRAIALQPLWCAIRPGVCDLQA